MGIRADLTDKKYFGRRELGFKRAIIKKRRPEGRLSIAGRSVLLKTEIRKPFVEAIKLTRLHEATRSAGPSRMAGRVDV